MDAARTFGVAVRRRHPQLGSSVRRGGGTQRVGRRTTAAVNQKVVLLWLMLVVGVEVESETETVFQPAQDSRPVLVDHQLELRLGRIVSMNRAAPGSVRMRFQGAIMMLLVDVLQMAATSLLLAHVVAMLVPLQVVVPFLRYRVLTETRPRVPVGRRHHQLLLLLLAGVRKWLVDAPGWRDRVGAPPDPDRGPSVAGVVRLTLPPGRTWGRVFGALSDACPQPQV